MEDNSEKYTNYGSEIEKLESKVKIMSNFNKDLKRMHKLGELQTSDFLAYFQMELEKKDIIIDKMNDEILKLEVERDFRIKTVEDICKTKVKTFLIDHEKEKNSLKDKISSLDDELQAHEEFKRIKETTENELQDLLDQVDRNEIKNSEDTKSLERNQIEELSKLQKATAKKIASLVEDIRIEAEKGLEVDSRKIATDNQKLNDEYNEIVKQSTYMQEMCSKLENTYEAMKRELSLFKEKEKVYENTNKRRTEDYKYLTNEITGIEGKYKTVIIEREVRDFLRIE